MLGLQGKCEEAKLAAARALPADKVAAAVAYARSLTPAAKPLTTAALDDGGQAPGPRCNERCRKRRPERNAQQGCQKTTRKRQTPRTTIPADDGTADAASASSTKVGAVRPPRNNT